MCDVRAAQNEAVSSDDVIPISCSFDRGIRQVSYYHRDIEVGEGVDVCVCVCVFVCVCVQSGHRGHTDGGQRDDEEEGLS